MGRKRAEAKSKVGRNGNEGEGLLEEERKAVLGIVAAGGTRQVAAKFVRRSVRAIERECGRNEEFARQLKSNEARLEVIQLKHIEGAGEKNWRASAWLLERMFPDRYAARKPRTLTRGEVATLWERMVEVVLGAVSSARTRSQIARRLREKARAWEEEECGSDEEAGLE